MLHRRHGQPRHAGVESSRVANSCSRNPGGSWWVTGDAILERIWSASCANSMLAVGASWIQVLQGPVSLRRPHAVDPSDTE